MLTNKSKIKYKMQALIKPAIKPTKVLFKKFLIEIYSFPYHKHKIHSNDIASSIKLIMYKSIRA
ncbi:hypothetical protein A2G94_07250 [Francisella endosymbiont of Ornithodoros moubata]|nr:hypothetical protein A2G94_07250 [Francisella endosymbiont of Ornithodoros moubata]